MRDLGRYYFGIALLLCALGVVSGCSREKDQTPLVEIKVQLKWIHQAQFSGFYIASTKGYYEDEGIKVIFLEGGQNVNIMASLLSGKADFSVVSPEVIFVGRQKDNAPVTAIAAIYGRSAAVYVSKKNSGIRRPADVIGRTAAVTSHTESNLEFDYQFRAMLKRMDLDIEKVRLVPYDPSYTDFYAGDVDITAAYYTSGVIHIRNKGHKVNLLWPNDYGIHFYSDTLVTTDRLIDQKPDLVERFLRATLKGWREAVGDPDVAVAETMKFARMKDLRLQADMMAALIPLVHTGKGPVGWMDEKVWQQMHQVMVDQNILGRPLDNVNKDNVSKAYTMRFLNSIYGSRN